MLKWPSNNSYCYHNNNINKSQKKVYGFTANAIQKDEEGKQKKKWQQTQKKKLM